MAGSSPRRTEKEAPRSACHPEAPRRRPCGRRPAPALRCSQGRHDHAIALANIALDLDPPAAGVEQAKLHRDQLAPVAGVHDLHREAAAGPRTSAVTGTLRASSTPLVVMSTWTGARSDPPAFAGLSEAGARGDGGAGDTSEPRDAPRHRPVARQRDRAQIALPGNRPVTGRVAGFGRVAGATIPTFVSLDNPAKAGGLDRAPVQVDITTKGVDDALSVPVTALVGRTGGGFAVEVVHAGDRRELVAVQLGLFDTGRGRVQVEGDVREGDRVVVPSI